MSLRTSAFFFAAATLLCSCGRFVFRGQAESERARVVVPAAEVDSELAGRIVVGSIHAKNSKVPLGIGIVDILNAVEVSGDTQLRSLPNCIGTWLVDGNVATAAHCFTKKIRAGDESCNTRVFKLAGSARTYPCRAIVWSSEKFTREDNEIFDWKKVSPDIVIFSLKEKPVGYKGLKLSAAPMQKNKTYPYWLYRKKYTADSTNFELQAGHDCQLSPFDTAPDAFPFRAVNCPIEPGDSGTPLMETSDSVQALLTVVLSEPAHKNFGSLAIDTSCLIVTEGVYSWKPGCEESGPLKLSFE